MSTERAKPDIRDAVELLVDEHGCEGAEEELQDRIGSESGKQPQRAYAALSMLRQMMDGDQL